MKQEQLNYYTTSKLIIHALTLGHNHRREEENCSVECFSLWNIWLLRSQHYQMLPIRSMHIHVRPFNITNNQRSYITRTEATFPQS